MSCKPTLSLLFFNTKSSDVECEVLRDTLISTLLAGVNSYFTCDIYGLFESFSDRMWNRNLKQTGANEAPLAAPRRWGGSSGNDQQHSSPGGYGGQSGGYGAGSGGYSQGGNNDYNRGPGGGGYDDRGRSGYDDRGRPPPPPAPMPMGGSAWDSPSRPSGYGGGGPPPPPPPQADAAPGERKRKSRWGTEKVDGALPVAITGGVESKDLENYATQMRLDEIARALRSGMVVPPDGARSPSPPPTYDSHGRRTNTREVRYRKKLEDERMRLVERQIKNDPSFRPPPEYLMAKRQNHGRPTDKVYIPVKDYPEINFFGLLVGPRGNSLKKMERESGAKISIRGKGSVKEGKGRPGGNDEDENDELHCLITADSEEKVQNCVKLINSVIETAASIPEGQNDHKRNQLRELAALNGTLRDDENQVCQNCGGIGHRKYDCPEQKNWTAGIICRVCGGAGHMARDCTQRRGGFGGPPGMGGPPGPFNAAPDPARAQQFDSEYASLMAELGETSAAPPAAGGPGAGADAGQPGGQPGSAPWQQGPHGGHPVDANGEKIPPWRIPSNWHPPQPFGGGFRGPPPGQGYGGGGPGYGGGPGPGYGGGGAPGGYPQQGQGGYAPGGYGQPQQQQQQGYTPQQSTAGGPGAYPGY